MELRNYSVFIVIACIIFFSWSFASPSGYSIFGGYFLSKALDYIWDSATGKPDVWELRSKIKEIEAKVVNNPAIAGELRSLSNSVSRNTTREDFNNMVRRMDNRITSLERRQDISERELNQLKMRFDRFTRSMPRYSPKHDSTPRHANPVVRDMYGAIAYCSKTRSYGYAQNYNSRAAAERSALRRCGRRGCRVVTWFRNACASLATASNGAYGWSWNVSRDRAIQQAINNCNRYGGRDCSWRCWSCAGNNN